MKRLVVALLGALVLFASYSSGSGGGSASSGTSAAGSSGTGASAKYVWKGSNLTIEGVVGDYVLTAKTDNTWEITGNIPSLSWSGVSGKGTLEDKGNGKAKIVTTHWVNYSTGNLTVFAAPVIEDDATFNDEKVVFTYKGPNPKKVTLTKTGEGAKAE